MCIVKRRGGSMIYDLQTVQSGSNAGTVNTKIQKITT